MPRTRTRACAVLLLPLLAGMAALCLLAPFHVDARAVAEAGAEPTEAPFELGAPLDAIRLPELAPLRQRFDASAIDQPPLHFALPETHGAASVEPLLVPVPEPSTGLLFALGLCGIAALRRGARV